jgi:hypothetical protein
VKTYIPKRLREIAEHPLEATDVTDESPRLTPNVSNVSGGQGVFPEKISVELEPQNLGTQRSEPRDTGVSSPRIPRSAPASTATDPNKPAAEFRTAPRPLERLLENLRAVHRQLEDDQAHGFILETFDLGVPSKLTVRGIHYQALERAVRSALERTPDAERVIVWTVQPDGWEVTCAQYHDSRKRVQA